jgi:hypothetical protein
LHCPKWNAFISLGAAGLFFRVLGIGLIDAFTADIGQLPAFDIRRSWNTDNPRLAGQNLLL